MKGQNTKQTKMSKKFPLGEHLTKNLRRVALFARTLTTYISGLNGQNAKFFCVHHQASKVTVLGKEIKMFFDPIACIIGQNMSLPPNLLQNLALLRHFFILLTLKPITLARVDEM